VQQPRWLGLILLVLTTLGCSAAGASRAQEPAVVPPEAEAAVQAAKDDLRARSGSVDEAEVQSIQQVDWSNASLGCPEPDRMYAQVITPGYRVVLGLQGQEYEYHTARTRAVYCAAGQAEGVPAS
jgi:hypothetical protein